MQTTSQVTTKKLWRKFITTAYSQNQLTLQLYLTSIITYPFGRWPYHPTSVRGQSSDFLCSLRLRHLIPYLNRKVTSAHRSYECQVQTPGVRAHKVQNTEQMLPTISNLSCHLPTPSSSSSSSCCTLKSFTSTPTVYERGKWRSHPSALYHTQSFHFSSHSTRTTYQTKFHDGT